MQLNKIYNEDCMITINNMDDNYLDLTITSPPYNVDLGNNKYNKNKYDVYNDNLPHEEYIKWLKDIFEILYKKTKSGGRCVINIGDNTSVGRFSHSDIIQFMVNIGWIPVVDIIWDKNNASNRTGWGTFKSPKCPSFPSTIEHIIAFAKESRSLQYEGDTDLTSDEFVKWSLSKWIFPGEHNSYGDHPAAFPIQLPIRCLKMFSWINSIVYDPFMGSGTTAIACIKTGRNYIGSEISKQYCDIADKRIFYEQQGKLLI